MLVSRAFRLLTIVAPLSLASAAVQAQGAPLSLQPPPAKAPAGATTPQTAQPVAKVPLPPVKQGATPAPLTLSPTPAPAPAPVAAPVAPVNETPQQTVARVNAYFNALPNMISDFVQIGSDGRRYDGKLYVVRPGKLRFEYNPPSPLEIVADGRSVVIRDRKLATQDMYDIGMTPLKFLLSDRIDLMRDAKLIGVTRNAQTGSVTVALEDKSTFGGTSRIRLVFDDAQISLRQWTITDPQGFDTQVVLSNLDTARRPSAKLFEIDYSRLPERKN